MPQVTEIRFAAAAFMLQRGDAARVVTLLAPVSADPHNPQTAAAAREMIAHALGRREQGSDAEAADEAAETPAD